MLKIIKFFQFKMEGIISKSIINGGFSCRKKDIKILNILRTYDESMIDL